MFMIYTPLILGLLPAAKKGELFLSKNIVL